MINLGPRKECKTLAIDGTRKKIIYLQDLLQSTVCVLIYCNHIERCLLFLCFPIMVLEILMQVAVLSQCISDKAQFKSSPA